MAVLLRRGGIWRDVADADLVGILQQSMLGLPIAASGVRDRIVRRLSKKHGVTFAAVGGGFALPHLRVRSRLTGDCSTVALVLLRTSLAAGEPAPDGVPITQLLFFVAPSARAHLELLRRLCRLLDRGGLRRQLRQNPSDAQILETVEAFDRS
jgi:PTS system nitrogen regulatory IIA component